MKKNNSLRDVIVIGAGAAGLMAAITAARAGARVLVLDHHTTPAKKILATGNGKCNFTNTFQDATCYNSSDPDYVHTILDHFSAAQTISFFQGIGILTKKRDGYCYPRSGQAATIREGLLRECDRLGIKINSETAITEITVQDNLFSIHTKQGIFTGRTCILATGGKASPKTGSDGSGFVYARQLGHHTTSLLPALCPLISSEKWLKTTAGVRCDARVTLQVDGKECASDLGELQFAEYGISGIPVFQISRFASSALQEKKRVSVILDLLPEYETETLQSYMQEQIRTSMFYQNWYTLLSGFVNQKLAAMLVSLCSLPEEPFVSVPEKKCRRQMDQLLRTLKALPVPITGTKGFEQAQVTCGGIRLCELENGTMMSKRVPGLYFAGEMLDVDGICGGYNLQWAWSSGYTAGREAANYSR